eukprot:XP_011610835.1 PREDICTED: uncharacterized protein LOC101068083 [Takifugu rubripes]
MQTVGYKSVFLGQTTLSTELPHDWKAEILVENEAAPSINEVMASGVPSGSGHRGHGNRYNELRSGTCCQLTAAALNYQPGFRSILYSTGWSLLKFWNIEVKNGHVKSVMDEDIRSFSIEVQGSSQTTYISFPHDLEDNLGIRQPIFNMLLKKSGEDFFCKITVTDEKSVQRQIFLSTFRKEMKARVFSGCVPIRLSTSWDYIIINLAEVTQQLFGTKYVKTVKIQIHANCRIRRVYFSDRLYSHEELPRDFKVKNLALSKMAHDIDKEMADQPSGVPTGSEHQGHDSGYNEPRSEMSCQTTAAAQDCTGWSSLKLWDTEVNTEHVKDFMEEDIKSLATEERERHFCSPERESCAGVLPQLECPSSPPGMDQDPLSTGSPVLSPDSSSHDAALSAPALSPADSENLSPDELELLAKLEEQNRLILDM